MCYRRLILTPGLKLALPAARFSGLATKLHAPIAAGAVCALGGAELLQKLAKKAAG